MNKKQAVGVSAVSVASGTAAAGTTLIATQVVAAAAVPTLMSTFSTVTAGVGSTMPLWLPAIQSFGAVSVGAAAISPIGLAIIVPSVVIGGAVGAATTVYAAKKLSSQNENEEPDGT